MLRTWGKKKLKRKHKESPHKTGEGVLCDEREGEAFCKLQEKKTSFSLQTQLRGGVGLPPKKYHVAKRPPAETKSTVNIQTTTKSSSLGVRTSTYPCRKKVQKKGGGEKDLGEPKKRRRGSLTWHQCAKDAREGKKGGGASGLDKGQKVVKKRFPRGMGASMPPGGHWGRRSGGSMGERGDIYTVQFKIKGGLFLSRGCEGDRLEE